MSIRPPDWTNKDDEAGFTMQTWAWGPQGHPASMRMVLYKDQKVPEQLWEFGPRILQRFETHKMDLESHMKRICELGDKVEARFSDDPTWHQCKKGCYGWTRSWLGRSNRCEKCADIGRKAEQEAAELFIAIAEGRE